MRDCYSKTKVDGTLLQPKGDPPKPPGQSSTLNFIANANAESDSTVCWYMGAPENWLMDSGATDHMTPFSTDFIRGSYVRYEESRNVVLGDGSTTLSIHGWGSTKHWIETAPQQFTKITLQDVLHVDGIKRRFLSMGRLANKGFTVTLSGQTVVIQKGDLRFKGFKTGTLYTCSLYSELPVQAQLGGRLNAVQALPIKTWHDCMGHLNCEAIKAVKNHPDNPPILGVRLDASDPPHGTCSGCVEGKAKRAEFKSSPNRRMRSSFPIE